MSDHLPGTTGIFPKTDRDWVAQKVELRAINRTSHIKYLSPMKSWGRGHLWQVSNVQISLLLHYFCCGPGLGFQGNDNMEDDDLAG